MLFTGLQKTTYVRKLETPSRAVTWAKTSWTVGCDCESHLTNRGRLVRIVREGLKQRIDIITFVFHRNYAGGW